MRYPNVLMPLVLLLAGSLSVAAAEELPATAVGGEEALAGANRVRYLLRQIDFSPEQMAEVEKLAGAELPSQLTAEAGLNEVKGLYAEIERELAKGAQRDQARIDDLTKRLRWLGADRSRDRTFLIEIEPMLSEVQREALKAARARLSRHPGGGVRPIDLAYAARALGLNAGQERRVEQVILESRERVGGGMKPTLAQRVDAINFCLNEIRDVLTPAQRPEYDRTVMRLRPDLVDEGLIAAPAQSGDDK